MKVKIAELVNMDEVLGGYLLPDSYDWSPFGWIACFDIHRLEEFFDEEVSSDAAK